MPPRLRKLKPGSHVTGKVRTKLAIDLRIEHERGIGIRELAEQIGRSYGFVNTLLWESGADVRPHGGHNRRDD